MRFPHFSSFSSFPDSIWERHCSGNSIAGSESRKEPVAAMELRLQVRSQIEFGNEVIIPGFLSLCVFA